MKIFFSYFSLSLFNWEDAIHFRVKPTRMPRDPTVHDLMAAQRSFPPNFPHETWHDFLYWDAKLEK